ncbi:RNA polymerase sigma factor SigM [Luedemannella helvata]|uniref:RNA polymerase sigma factor SigM n=1 Tax=Luedemannella helvata TaxID=349315 RepID=A0ABP4X444_9ACTN
MTDPRTDDALMRAHVSGDRQAFAELVRRHRDRLWAVALRTLADREEAADAVQDALLAAYRGAERFRGDSAVTTWLHRIVVNACLDRLRRRQARPTVPLPEPDSPALVPRATTLPDVATELTVRDALRALPDEQRTVLVLVDMEGFPVAEVAAMLGIAEGTVKSRCARGRARLAVALGHLRLSDEGHTPARGSAGNRAAPAAVGTEQGSDDAEGGAP